MKVLVVGANGATGKRLITELLNRQAIVTIIVRKKENLSDTIKSNKNVNICEAEILRLSDLELLELLQECEAVASCLGHNLTFKGLFGQPKMLVTDAVKKLCSAIMASEFEKPVKFVLMNTTGNKNNELNEQRTTGEKIVFSILRNMLPPQLDNERSAEYLNSVIGRGNNKITWSVVRPDSLIEEDSVSQYEVLASPNRSPVFDAGKTSRINVAHFMAELITNETTWNAWKWQMPVIYNKLNGQ